MSSPETESPFNALPPVVVALVLVIMGIEITFNLGARGIIGGPDAVGWRLEAWQSYAFSGDVLDWMIRNNSWPTEHLIRFVSYPFVHGNFTSALFAGVILLAMGKMVAEVMHPIGVLVLFLSSSIMGALAYWFFIDATTPLISAYPPCYGMIGAFTYGLWVRLKHSGGPQIRAFTLIGFLLGIQLVFGALFGSNTGWVADLGGFVTGFVLSVILMDGGWTRLLAKMRRD